jgi:hypothetical protein
MIYAIEDFFDPTALPLGSINRYRDALYDIATLFIEDLRAPLLYQIDTTPKLRALAISRVMAEFKNKIAQISSALANEIQALRTKSQKQANQAAGRAIAGTAAAVGLWAMFSN